MNKLKKILVCPLDWGLGHASRCVPIINELIEANAEVFLAADNSAYDFLKREFPQLQIIRFKGFEAKYSSSKGMVLKILASAPSILLNIYKEHVFLNTLIDTHHFDGVISDNRYGLWSKKVNTVFITHQIRIKAPFVENLLYKINSYFINKFDSCWIPDHSGKENLSGELSHENLLPLNSKFIGPLSRFKVDATISNNEYDLLVLISGPEPQRQIFEQIIIKQLREGNLNANVICGLPKKLEMRTFNNVNVYSHLETHEIAALIQKSKIIVCRSGYSTIMDLSVFGKKVIFVPTPGQTEQEYLANLFSKRGQAVCVNQSDFDLMNSIKELESKDELKCSKNDNLLNEVVRDYLRSL